MKVSVLGSLALALLIVSCNEPFKKEENGMQYKIIGSGKGETVKQGNYLEINFKQIYQGAKDSVLFDSWDKSAQVVMLDSAGIPPVYFKIFTQCRKGDSVIIKQLTDSIMKMGGTPPFMKKGQYIVTHYKIMNVFTDKAQADSATQAQMALAKTREEKRSAEQLIKDDKAIQDYLKANKITATKAPAGTYVEIVQPGAGPAFDSSSILKVNYTGRLLDGGKVFDSNTDPQFNHVEPFRVNLGVAPGMPGSVIKGWVDGLSILQKGAKARLYIPSSLAYGAQGAGADIQPNSNLLFDVEILDVLTAEQAKAEEEAEQKRMQEMQRQAMDSMMKAQKKDSAAKK